MKHHENTMREGIYMKTTDIYLKTMKFVWLKLAMGAVITLASIILLALFMLIGSAFGGGGMYIMLILWLALTGGIYKFAMYYFGYMLKAGHVAVIATAVTTGRIPDNQFEYGKQMVASRFAATNVYFLVDRLVSGAVHQLQKVVGKIGGALDVIPGMGSITGILQTFIGIALGYVDECCLGYCFLHNQEGAFKASCDGVVIYFQNTKKLLKDAAVTTLIVILATAAAWILPFAIFVAIFKALHWSMLAAVLLAFIVALVVKAAFIDSYMLVKMMVSYMEVAPSTQITYDLYDKLCGLSSKFKELFGKAREEGPVNVRPAMAGGAQPAMAGSAPTPMQTASAAYTAPAANAASAARFCPHCGQPVSGGAFCNKCGARL